MAVVMRKGSTYEYDSFIDADAIFIMESSVPGGQVQLQGTTFATATLSVCGRYGVTGTGPNGNISDSDATGFSDWDSVDLTNITGRTAVLDEDVRYAMVKVGGLTAGTKVTVF